MLTFLGITVVFLGFKFSGWKHQFDGGDYVTMPERSINRREIMRRFFQEIPIPVSWGVPELNLQFKILVELDLEIL